ncbi:MAG: hypothetical protein KGS73_16945 [Chloroflexi bacterium]|nr:hypothetical protein [Chloroflexota bacterium]
MNLSKPTDGKLPTKRVWMAGGISILGSVIANLVVYWVGQMVVNPDPGFQPLAGPGPTIFFTVAFLLVATLVYLAINAYTKQPVRIFTIVAVIVFLVGLIPDFLLFGEGVAASMGMGAATPGAVVLLILMHIMAFAITLWAFTRWAHSR